MQRLNFFAELYGANSYTGDIPITDPEVTNTASNLERAVVLEIDIPIEQLIIADVVFQTIGSGRY